MRDTLSKSEAQNKISEFFQKSEFSAEEVKKIKRLGMKYKIKLGTYRKLFCKKCLLQLKGKIRITKTHKTVICQNCKYTNKIKLKN